MNNEIIFTDIEYCPNIEIKELTTIKTQGRVKGVFYPKNEKELIFIYNFLKINNIKFELIGNGSNILFSPSSKDILLISTKKVKENIKKYRNFVIFPSSLPMYKIFQYCLNHSLAGFEKIATIPGTLGGAIKVNAGCFGDSVFDNLVSIKILKNGKVINLPKSKINYGYRYTNLADCLILSAKFDLKNKNKCQLNKEYIDCLTLRSEKQPKGFSMGSIFKNPTDFSAGYLIEQCGLKGSRKNDAIISEKHANIIINENNASYEDIIYLINLAKERVKEKFNINLELEIKIY